MSNFFKYFPRLEYGEATKNTVTNILVRSKIRDMIKTNTVLYYPYVLQDGDRPDIIADKYYGSSQYTWVVLYANEVRDPIFDWHLPHSEFISYITNKYGGVQPANQQVHHYENERGFVIDQKTYLDIGVLGKLVSCLVWEEQENEAKRNIKLIDRSYISIIQEELKSIFRES